MALVAQFAVRLWCGMCLVLLGMPRRAVASGFFRTQMLIVMGLATLASLAAMSQMSRVPGTLPVLIVNIAGAVLGFLASVLWTLERRSGAERCLWLLTLTGIGGLVVGVAGATGSMTATAATALVVLSELSSALLLGAATCGMLLGHSYLTSPTMSISPLSRLNHWLGASALLRGIVSGVALALASPALNWDQQITWLLLRWIAGVAGPLLMAVMVSRILLYKNTQAATGVLFVAVILTFMSEVTGELLLVSTGYPL